MKREKIKNEIYYIWTMYKIPSIGAIVLALVIGGFVLSAIKGKDNTLEVMFIDSFSTYSDSQMESEYVNTDLTDSKKWDILTIGSLMFSGTESDVYVMNSLSRFMSDIGSNKLDVCGMLIDDYEKYDKSGLFLDLSVCFTSEELDKFEGQFLKTSDGRLIGIYADAFPRLKKWNCYENKDNKGVVGIIYNSRHINEAKQYITKFLAEDN